jgi:hypothetical protein
LAISWIDPSTVEGSQEEPPPLPTPEEMQLPDGVELQLTELDAFPEFRWPEGIPVLRPSFWAYVLGLSGATSLEDFLTTFVVPGAPPNPIDPDPYRLYAGTTSVVDNQGANVSINSFYGLIEPGTMSLLEMQVGCKEFGEMWQAVGIASSRHWALAGFPNFGDFVLRLQVEFFTDGTAAQGNGVGGWSGTWSVTDFVPAQNAPYGPGAAFAPHTVSTVGGPQYESLYQIRRLVDSNGYANWWVGHNGHWLGYYPGRLFAQAPVSLLSAKACEVSWYGEVHDPTPVPLPNPPPESPPEGWTWTDMGSGFSAEAGWPNAAYFRNPSYISLDAAGTPLWPPSDPSITSDIPADLYNPECYTKTALTSGPSPWDRFYFVGGDGKEPWNKCNGPTQTK